MTQKLNIPYISSRGMECGQTCAAMMLKYFIPDFEPDFELFNKLIHHENDKYTFPPQNAIILDHFGIKCQCYSSDILLTTVEKPDIFQKWYGDEWKEQMKQVNVDSYNWMVEETRKRKIFTQKETTLDEIVGEFLKGHLVTIVIDWNRLNEKKGQFQGHFILLSGLDEENLLFHDPDDGPYKPYAKTIVNFAYHHPVITNDLLIAYEKKG